MSYKNYIPVDNFEKLNLFSRIQTIEKTLRELKIWKDEFANPNLRKNIENIKTIHNNITNVVLPRIEDAVNQAQEASNKATQAMDSANLSMKEALNSANIAKSARDSAIEALNKITEFTEMAENAANSAKVAAENAKAMLDRLHYVSEGLINDINEFNQNASYLVSVILTDLGHISATFQEFGSNVLQNSIEVSRDIEGLVNQLRDAVNEISVPLNYVADQARSMATNIADAWDLAQKLDYLGSIGELVEALNNAKNGFEVLTFKPYGGQNSVFFEIIEAFNQISNAFFELKDSMTKLGSDLSSDGEDIKDVIIMAKTDIDDATNKFLSSFLKIFNNMTLRLKGEKV